jgi:3-oxoacyl-[acyl-carrier-protein] synthase-3
MKISASSITLLHLIAGASAFAPAPTSDGRFNTELMASSGRMNCRPIGIGSAVPDTIITNLELESVVETNDEWIQSRTGISQRHVLTGDESLRTLGAKAAQRALDMAGISAADLDLIICATSSPDDMFGDATAIAAEIGCTKDCVGFDLTAACSGFLLGSVTAGQFLSCPGTSMKYVLVVGADALSRWVDWDDRNSCILFGDGAGAMIVTNEGDGESGLLGFSAHSNGEGYKDLNCL